MRTPSTLYVVHERSGWVVLGLVLACAIAMPPHAEAQSETGTVVGVVETTEGRPAPGVNVRLRDAGRGAVTGAEGRFRIDGVEPGSYRLIVSAVGFQSERVQVRVRGEETTQVEVIRLQPSVGELEEVVVTATRNRRSARDLPVPVSVIDAQEIESQGAARVTELLADQPGLTINNDHGSGLQMRGLDADYTLILVNGEPIIGRSAGTLDLDRLTTANVERVEIVRGPTSSLYGSEALAGVVNIITRRPDEGVGADVRARYGTHATSDLSARIGGGAGRWQGSLFADRYRTGGYDLAPGTMTPTQPGYVDYTVQGRGELELGPGTALSLQGRLAAQDQDYRVGVDRQGESGTVAHTQTASRLDWNVSPELETALGSGWRLTTTLYGAGYHTDQTLRQSETGSVRSSSSLDQYHGELEGLLRGALGSDHLLTVGAGVLTETIEADRKVGDRIGGFGFVQDEWTPAETFELTGSVRIDGNSDYAARLSPKLAARYEVSSGVAVRASVGSGYKAPAFRQLYLDFTNPQVGYTVLGVTKVEDGLARLEEQGRIEELFRSPAKLGAPLEPESSVAFNAGLTADLSGALNARLDLYHNEVDHLIDAQPIARRTNGQNVFTYVNRNAVFTRGVEARLTYRPTEALELEIGYDYLEARDREVLEDLEEGTIFRRVNGRDVRVTPEDYAGLPGRAAHSGTLALRYGYDPLGLRAHLQGTIRSRAGYADRNGNGIIDVGREYVEGRSIWDLTLSKELLDAYTLRIGGRNLLGYTNHAKVPSIPGRRYFVEIQARF